MSANEVILAKVDKNCIYATAIIDKEQTHIYFPRNSISYISAVHENSNSSKYILIVFLNNGARFHFRYVSEEQLTSIYEMLNR